MLYPSGDDPRLLEDLRSSLKHWHRPTLGDLPLAHCLTDVDRRLAANPRLTRSTALQQSIRAALTSLSHSGQAERARLLERRYFQELSIYRLEEIYHLGERSIYYRLKEATLALAQALWVVEQGKEEARSAPHTIPEPLPGSWRARYLPPPTYTRLFGVDSVLADLLERLRDRHGHWMISLDGMGGLGKTALAREAAGRLAYTDRFADISWLRARSGGSFPAGSEPAERAILTCSELLEGIARQLTGVDLTPLPFQAKRERVHGLLQSRPYLVVVDNLEVVTDCEDLPAWFWEVANPSKFLFTSRQRIEPATGLSVLLLDQLSERDGLALIRHEGYQRGLQAVAEGRDDVLGQVLAVTGGNPLAIKLVVGQLASLPLSQVLDGLQNVRKDSSQLYDHLYGTAWDLLSPPARHLLVQMALLPDGGGTWEELLAIASLPAEELAAAVVELATCSMVQVSGLETKIYCIHPLTCHFVLRQTAGMAAFEERS